MSAPVFKLGKHPKRSDRRTLQLAHYLGAGLPTAPPAYDNTGKVPAWGMLRNDTIGDCTCAGAAHLVMQWTADAGKEARVTDAQVLTAYKKITGYNPKTGANDNGSDLLTVLNYWRKTGIGGHKLPAFAEVKVTNLVEVEQATFLFGGLYTGVLLPLSAQGQTVWDVPATGLKGRGKPGSWGGHCVPIVAYDATYFYCVTWGQVLKMTRAFFTTYFDEAYAGLGPDFLSPAGTAINGFNAAQLQADLAAL